MNPTNGKGSSRLHARQQLSDEEMQENWNKAFPKRKPESKEPDECERENLGSECHSCEKEE